MILTIVVGHEYVSKSQVCNSCGEHRSLEENVGILIPVPEIYTFQLM